MKIGIVTTWFERGAAYVSKQFKHILDREHDVFIYARGGEEYAIGDSNWDGNFVWWGKRRISPFNPTYIDKKDFVKWLKYNQINIVIFNEQRWLLPVIWCKQMNIKTLAYVDYYTNSTIPFFDIYDALICNTKRHHSAFQNHKKSYYIPWGTNTELYKPISNNYSLVNNKIVTIFHSAGMNGYRKGTDILIRAYLKSKQECKLIIHCQKNIVEEFPLLEKSLIDLQNKGKLELIIGSITAPGLYYKGDVYIYPTRLEGIGLTIAEAISSGLVCIVPDNGPMNEFVNDNHGFLIPVTKYFCREDGYYWPLCEVDENNLACFINYCSEHPQQICKMKGFARKYAEDYLCLNKNFSNLLTIIQEVEFNEPEPTLINKIIQFNTKGINKLEPIYMRLYPIVSILEKLRAVRFYN